MISVFFTCYRETGFLSKHLTSVHVVRELFLSRKPRKKTNTPAPIIHPSANPSFFVMSTHDIFNWCPFLENGLFLTRNILETSRFSIFFQKIIIIVIIKEKKIHCSTGSPNNPSQ